MIVALPIIGAVLAWALLLILLNQGKVEAVQKQRDMFARELQAEKQRTMKEAHARQRAEADHLALLGRVARINVDSWLQSDCERVEILVAREVLDTSDLRPLMSMIAGRVSLLLHPRLANPYTDRSKQR